MGSITIARQRWEDMLTIHWRAPADEVARDLPNGVDVDVFDGSAWLSLVAFRARAFGRAFLEINLRTYVAGAGIWLYSADVTSTLARAAYRTLLGAAARRADVAHTCIDDRQMWSARAGYSTLTVRARRNVDGVGDDANVGLTRFLLDRDVQLSRRAGLLWQMRVRHAPLAALPVKAIDVVADDWLRGRRAPRVGAPALALFTQDVDVDILAPRPIARARGRARARRRLAHPEIHAEIQGESQPVGT